MMETRLLTPDELSILKSKELDILKWIDHLCSTNGIDYFLVGGTLIGAVRHSGFIPWDDDIDIGMLRSDYDKFLALVSDMEKPAYTIVNYETCNGAGEPFTKVMDMSIVMVEGFASNANVPHGAFVDLFPFDNAPNSKHKRKRQSFRSYYLRKMILLKQGYKFRNKGLKKVLYALLQIWSRCHSLKRLEKRLYKNAIRYNNTDTDCVVNLGGNYSYSKEMAKKALFTPVIQLNFEGYMFCVPNGYAEYLAGVYGDYMRLPPEKDRVNKHSLVYFEVTDNGEI